MDRRAAVAITISTMISCAIAACSGARARCDAPIRSLDATAKIEWSPLIEEDMVRREILARLPETPAIADVRRFAGRQELACSEVIDAAMHCSAPATSDTPFFRTRWLILFQFQGDALTAMQIDRTGEGS